MIRLFNHWLRLRTLLEIATDFSFVIVGGIAMVLWLGNGSLLNFKVVIACSLALAISTLSFNAWMGFYQSTHTRTIFQSVLRATFSLALAALFAYVIFSYAPLADDGHQLLALPAMTAVLGMVVHRLGVSQSGASSILVRRVLIFGAGEHAL